MYAASSSGPLPKLFRITSLNVFKYKDLILMVIIHYNPIQGINYLPYQQILQCRSVTLLFNSQWYAFIWPSWSSCYHLSNHPFLKYILFLPKIFFIQIIFIVKRLYSTDRLCSIFTLALSWFFCCLKCEVQIKL